CCYDKREMKNPMNGVAAIGLALGGVFGLVGTVVREDVDQSYGGGPLQTEMTAREQRPYVNTREDSAVRFLGIPTVMRSTGETTNGAFGLIEHLMIPPGWASPYHTHHLEDEAFYVLEGEVAFICDGKW